VTFTLPTPRLEMTLTPPFSGSQGLFPLATNFFFIGYNAQIERLPEDLEVTLCLLRVITVLPGFPNFSFWAALFFSFFYFLSRCVAAICNKPLQGEPQYGLLSNFRPHGKVFHGPTSLPFFGPHLASPPVFFSFLRPLNYAGNPLRGKFCRRVPCRWRLPLMRPKVLFKHETLPGPLTLRNQFPKEPPTPEISHIPL